jgi:hypothetical protein
VGSFFDTNLTYREDDQTTLAQYDIHGSAERLLDLIKKLEANDSELLANIAVEEIIDYAALAYSSNAFDSLTQNYYVYFDQTDLKWHIFPWDGDQSYKNIPERVANNQVWNYLRNNEGSYNNLLYYLGNNLTRSRYNRLYRDFTSRYQSLDLANLVETKSQNFREYLIYDNQLWNGKFLERRQVEYDTLKSLNDLRQDLENQNF